MTSQSIADTVAELTKHVRTYAHITAWDIDHMPTDIEIDERAASIDSVCDEIDQFAGRSNLDDTRFPDFEALRWKLADHGAYPLLEHMRAVADAFFRADRLDARSA